MTTTTNFTIDKSVNISHFIYMLFLIGAIVTVYAQTQSKLEVHQSQIIALQDAQKSQAERVDQRFDRTDDKIDQVRTLVENQSRGR